MYYYETLNSIDYRGSMTSLQSCQSGFSTISKVRYLVTELQVFQNVVIRFVNLTSVSKQSSTVLVNSHLI